jgi:hypothetical protein
VPYLGLHRKNYSVPLLNKLVDSKIEKENEGKREMAEQRMLLKIQNGIKRNQESNKYN